MADATVGDEESLVNLPLPIHAFAHLRFAHQSRETMLQHAGTDSSQHVTPGAPLEHHTVDTREMEQLGKEQPGGPASDNADIGAYRICHQERLLVVRN